MASSTNPLNKNGKRDFLFPLLAVILFGMVLLAYSNHFHNGFHFDDDHTIVNNIYIRNLHYLPDYFKSATTFSSLPMNQTYRPMLTALYAFNYHLGGLDPFYFHLSAFIFFLLNGTLIYFVILKIFNLSAPSPANRYFALFACGWYLLNTANSDAINYVSASSDTISTFWVMAGLAHFIYFPRMRKWMLYLIPVAIGALFKQSALVFPGLIALYCFLFENESPAAGAENLQGHAFSGIGKKIFRSCLATLPSLILCAGLYILQAKLTSPTYITGGIRNNYIITQPFVALHYFINFFIPIGLSADSDWEIITSLLDYRLWTGLLFLLTMGFALIWLYPYRKYAPIVFGLAFFLIALLPSSIAPLSEVMNDYRSFFPYIGLAIASSWLLCVAWQKRSNALTKYALIVIPALMLVCHSFGVHARNKVWQSDEALWYDVTVKSPGNARGLMNYGLTQMNKGNLSVAEEYFNRAVKMVPHYPYIYANLGVLKSLEKKNGEADSCFRMAMLCGPGIPAIGYFYAKFLHSIGNDERATGILRDCIAMAPADVNSRYLAMQIYFAQQDWQNLAELARQTLALVPGDKTAQSYLDLSAGKKTKLEAAIERVNQNPTAPNYLSLSLEYYHRQDYLNCIEACNKAISINPSYSAAYNNKCSAYNMLQQWDSAISAGEKAVRFDSTSRLARNNLIISRQGKVRSASK